MGFQPVLLPEEFADWKSVLLSFETALPC
jgi:hypothetical protein